MRGIFNKSKQKKKRSSSTADIDSERKKSVCVGPKRRSSQETLIYNKYDPTQEHYGQLANNLAVVNRTLNSVLRDVMNGDNASPSIGTGRLRHTRNDDGYDSDDTAASVDSLQISGFKLFGREINDYNSKRNMPIVSLALKTGNLLFPSQQSLDYFKKSHKWRLTGSMERSLSSSQQAEQIRKSIRNDANLGTTINPITAVDSNPVSDDDKEVDHLTLAEIEYEEDSDLPLFHISTPPLAQFRKNCPYMTISKYYVASELRTKVLSSNANPKLDAEEPIKYVFCKVHDKYIKSGIKRFTLEFTPNLLCPSESFKVVMFTHRSKPYTDTIYKGTKLRFVGTSVCTSVFGSSSIQLMVMNEPEAISLLDNMTEDDKPALDNPLLKEETTLTDISAGSIIYKLYGNSTLPPLAKFTDHHGDILPRKVQKLGQIFCYEAIDLTNRDDLYGDYNNVKQVKLDTMVITCMLLVLREQENKKNPRSLNSQFARGLPYASGGGASAVYGSYDNPFPLGNIW